MNEPVKFTKSFEGDELGRNLHRFGSLLGQFCTVLRKPRPEDVRNLLDQLANVAAGLVAAKETVEILPPTHEVYVEGKRLLESGWQVLHREVGWFEQASDDTQAAQMANKLLDRLDSLIGCDCERLSVRCCLHQVIKPNTQRELDDHQAQRALELNNAGVAWPEIFLQVQGFKGDSDQVRAFKEVIRRFAKRTNQTLRQGVRGRPRKN